MPPYEKGLRGPSAPHKVANRAPATAHYRIGAAFKAGIRGSADLAPYRTKRMHQGRSRTCFAHSAAAVSWMARAAAGKPLLWVPSPVDIAANVYARERALLTPAGAPLERLQDTGAELADVVAVLSEDGVSAIHAPTPDGRYSDVMPVGPGEFFPEPRVQTLELDLVTILHGEYAIDPSSSDAPQIVAASLDSAIPVWNGFFCDTAFEEMKPGDVAGAPNTRDPQGGGHATYIGAYRTTGRGDLEFRIENSWGDDYCEGGASWADEAWLRANWELWPFAIGEAA